MTTLKLNLTPELEQQLLQKANQQGLEPENYALSCYNSNYSLALLLLCHLANPSFYNKSILAYHQKSGTTELSSLE